MSLLSYHNMILVCFIFFFQAEDGIRDYKVTGVQTCALPILRTGFARATCEVIVMIDADGSMDPAEIESYVRAVNEGYDLVKGSRATGGSTDLTPTRLLGNFCLRGLVNLLYSADFTELCYGFMALRRTSVPAMELASDGFAIETAIVVNSLRRGLRNAEIPSHETERLNGVSHLHPVQDGLRMLSTLVRACLSQP